MNFLFDDVKPVSERIKTHDTRIDPHKLLTYGIDFLDKAMRGIWPTDLILLGAPTGIGKTQLATKIALANCLQGKRVTYLALEEAEGGLEDRMLYSRVANGFFSDPNRPPAHFNYTDWILGKFDAFIDKYEAPAREELSRLNNMFTYYNAKDFSADKLSDLALAVAHESDLIILDHIHYMALSDRETENAGIKKIMQTVRDIVLRYRKPIIVISHLRKKERKGSPLVPDIDDFMGSSDLSKISTTTISLAPGDQLSPTQFVTYIRLLKNRLDGSLRKYVAKLKFSTSRGEYEDNFVLGKLSNDATEFIPIEEGDKPHWAKGLNRG